jgi:hypothetical protein
MENQAPSQPGNSQDNLQHQDIVHGNQITTAGKIFAGFLLVFFTVSSLLTIIAFWPDKLPTAKLARYERKLFQINLLDSASVKPCCTLLDSINTTTVKPPVKPAKKDSLKKDTAKKDTGKQKGANGTPGKDAKQPPVKARTLKLIDIEDTIQFNTVLLILVAAAGFLGNMVHVSTSFTTFIGAGQFKRSWILWYSVKPFTASALALIVYFAFRAGFLSANDGGNNLNLYGIMSISALAGLFTDTATQKLKEVFEVIFRPKEQRPNALQSNVKPTFTAILPDKLNVTGANDIVIKGTDLDKQKLTITINDVQVPDKQITIASTLIHVTYVLNDADKTKKQVVLIVSDDHKALYNKKWDI